MDTVGIKHADLNETFLPGIFAALRVALVKRGTADCHLLGGIIGSIILQTAYWVSY